MKRAIAIVAVVTVSAVSVACASDTDAPATDGGVVDSATADADNAVETSTDAPMCQAIGEVCDPTDPKKISSFKCCSRHCTRELGADASARCQAPLDAGTSDTM